MVALGFLIRVNFRYLKVCCSHGFAKKNGGSLTASAMAASLRFRRLTRLGWGRTPQTWRQFCAVEEVGTQGPEDLPGTKGPATSKKPTVDELAKILVGETDVLSTILQTFKREKLSEFSGRDLNQAVSACAKASCWQEACLFLASVPRGVADVISFNATIRACEKGMQWQIGLHFLKEMTRRKGKMTPDTITYNTIIHSCEKSGEWQLALHLFEEMLLFTRRPSPDVITFTTLISGCDTLGQWQATLQLFSQMLEQYEDLVPPNSGCFASAINSAEKSSKWRDALSWLKRMKENDLRLNGLTFTAGIRAAKRGKLWKSALELLQMMPSSKIEPTQLSFYA